MDGVDTPNVVPAGPRYSPPSVEVLGAVVDVTEQVKNFNASDGTFFTIGGVPVAPEGPTS